MKSCPGTLRINLSKFTVDCMAVAMCNLITILRKIHSITQNNLVLVIIKLAGSSLNIFFVPLSFISEDTDMAWHGMAWHGMAWHGMAWHGMAWHGMT